MKEMNIELNDHFFYGDILSDVSLSRTPRSLPCTLKYRNCPHTMWSRVYVTVRCPSVCLSRSSAALRCCGFAAVGPASRNHHHHHHHHHHFICPIIQQYVHLHEYNFRRAGQQGPIRTLTAALKRSIKTVTGCIFYHTNKNITHEKN